MPECPPFRHFEQIKRVHSRSLLVYKFFGLPLILEKKTLQFSANIFIYLFIFCSSSDFGEKNTSIFGEDLFLLINFIKSC